MQKWRKYHEKKSSNAIEGIVTSDQRIGAARGTRYIRNEI